MTRAVRCKICDDSATYIFSKKVLGKYDVQYFRCTNCFFVQTEEPHWLEESYANAITSLDLGLVYRNLLLAPVVEAVIAKWYDPNKKFVDFGGGYGMFVRMMRDKGYDFYRQDKFCENLFAKHFDVEDLQGVNKFEMLTSFEVFEHLANPLEGIREMINYSRNIMFSTELIPDNISIADWYYISPHVGQHISFYHYRTLQELARIFKLNVYSNGSTLHLLTERKLSQSMFRLMTRPKAARAFNMLFSRRSSLLMSDHDAVKKKLYE